MDYKILEANGVDNENVDGAAFNNFISSSQPGIIQGILNECPVYQINSTTVGIGTGELIISGFRIKILSDYSVQQSASVPDTEFQIAARITLNSDRSVMFEFICRPPTALRQDDLFKTESGVYEAEVARFVMTSTGLKSYKRTIPVISVKDAVSKYAEQAILAVQQQAEASIEAAENQVNLAAERVEEAYASVQGLDGRVSRNDKRITNLEKGLGADAYETDSDIAYVKDVPENSLPYAAVSKIGGMSYKSKNLIPYPYSNVTTDTIGGVNVTINADQSIALNGTATTDIYRTIATVRFKANTTYHLGGIVSGKADLYVSNPYRPSGALAFDTDVTSEIVLYIPNGATFSNETMRPMLNEGASAPYEPYFSGLRDAKVTEVKSVSNNLLTFPYVSESQETNGVMWTVNSDGTVTANGTATADSVFYLMVQDTFNSGSYYLSGCPQGGSATTFKMQVNTGNTGLGIDFGTSTQIVYYTNAPISVFIVVMSGTTVNNLTFKPMLNKGYEAKPYTRYNSHTIVIPESVQSLEGYGLGVDNTHYNYIDFESKKFNRCVKKVDLGSLEWIHNVSGGFFLAYIDYTYGYFISDAKSNSKVSSMYIDVGASVVVVYGDFVNQHDIKELLNGYTLIYDLKNTTTEDIEITDNLIGVEGNGTITFKNEYKYPVPSEVIYQLKRS